MLALLLGSSDALMAARAPAVRLRADLRMVVKGREWETANVPRGKVTMNPFNNLKQMQVCSSHRLYGGDQPIYRTSMRPRTHARAASAAATSHCQKLSTARRFVLLVPCQDQRVAGVSHINLAPGKCTLPLQEAIDLMKSWKVRARRGLGDGGALLQRATAVERAPAVLPAHL